VATVSRRLGNLAVRSKVGSIWRRNHFREHDRPTHEVKVDNRNGGPLDIQVEIVTESEIIRFDGNPPPWRSKTMPHAGQNTDGKCDWLYETELSFTGADPQSQLMYIKVYIVGQEAEGESRRLAGVFPHIIWVK
jgi:hypothetical protein